VPVPLYPQTVIAFLWDFDPTLIPGNQQDPLFTAYGVDEATFWTEVDGLVDHYASRGVIVARDAAYLLHILAYVEEGGFKGVRKDRFTEIRHLPPPAPQ